MKRRNAIAVLIGHNNANINPVIMRGIAKQAHELDYDVAVFSIFSLAEDYSIYMQGEENIYRLINPERFAGYIFLESTFWVKRLKNGLINMLREKTDGNVVFLDSFNCFEFDCVVPDDYSCFKKVVDHLIEKHEKKKIYCFTGYKDDAIAEMRMDGYLDSMKEHGLEVKDSYRIYGDFSQNSAVDLAEKILSGELERPEAIACASDFMASKLVGELIAGGIRVPEDIAVSSYDFSDEGFESIPSITSYTRPDSYSGALSVCKIHNRFTGKTVEPCIENEAFFVDGESCGCHKNYDFVKKYSIEKRSVDLYVQKYFDGDMQECLFSSENFDVLMQNASKYTYILRGFKRFSICLNDNWNEFSENDNIYIKSGYSENMFVPMTRIDDYSP